jgi:hypothetical protein
VKIIDWWKSLRFRYKFMVGGSLAAIIGLVVTDPDKGTSTGLWLLMIGAGMVALLLAHWGRKALHDYPEADARKLFGKASQDPVGAGLALVALALVFQAVLGLFAGRAHAQTPDPRAAQFAPIIQAEMRQHWPDLPWPHYTAALIAHESGCPSLRSCWSPTAQLKTAREEGAGLGQITRAWRPDGSLRFDSLADMRDKHPALREWSWLNVYQRPDLQIRAVVLMSRGNWQALRAVADPWERLTMTNAAYNGGLGGVQADRRACQVKAGCDPQRWWGHVEHTCTKSQAALYGKRSACDINRDHSRHVMLKELPKYRALVS